ncbi:hypothetical protein J4221_06145 [Candidatus Pacearchaeota archaeon]|nr:hypothetical protein [Candidatus Pacearchaeota archaeon]
MEIPKFLYHGTTQERYEAIKKDWCLFPYLDCTSDIILAACYAYRRSRQEHGYPILLIIESEKHIVKQPDKEYYHCRIE